MQKNCFVFGACPEVVKFAPLVHEFQQRKVDFFMVYTGQSQSAEMLDALLRELAIPAPDYSLQHTSWVFNVMDGVQQLTAILRFEQPNVVFVQDDTNSTLVATLAAKAVGLPILNMKTGRGGGKIFAGEQQNSLPISKGILPIAARIADGHQPVI